MNEIEQIKERVLTEFPTAIAIIDEPLCRGASWDLEIGFGKRNITVAWRSGDGFTISDCSYGTDRVFGEGPDFVYTNLDEAVAKVFELLRK